MSDILDEIIARLSPSVKNLLEKDCGPEYQRSKWFNNELQNSLQNAFEIEIDQMISKLKIDTSHLISKTARCRNELKKYKEELEKVKETDLETAAQDSQRLEVYSKKIVELELQLQDLFKGTHEGSAADLFTEVDELYNVVKTNIKKSEEIKNKLDYYEGLPPNIEEARTVIKNLQEEIEKMNFKLEIS